MGVIAISTKKFFGKNDVLSFGKHKGRTIEEVRQEDPAYIVWLDENVHQISIDQKIVSDCEEDIHDSIMASLDDSFLFAND